LSANNPVTGNYDRHRVTGQGLPYRPGGSRLADYRRQPTVAYRLSITYTAGGRPDHSLEIGRIIPVEIVRKRNRRTPEIGRQPPDQVVDSLIRR
jgi:hypothetical protein